MLKKFNFRPTVLVEEVSRTLSEAILEGIYKGGERLIESELKGQFGISRSPIREAFRDLEKKGLVEIVPRKGTFVKKITRRDIEEHFPVRSVLEGLAAREAYERMTKEDLEDMADELGNMKKAVSKNDTKKYWHHHLLFHEIFIDASENLILIKLLKTLRMHSMWYRFSYQYYKEDLNKSLAVHESILTLFRNKNSDPKALEGQVRDHIEIAVERFLAYLEEQERRDESNN
ncbi:MAG: GntR family transcriptional regulator [Pseudomonadota bacterium]